MLWIILWLVALAVWIASIVIWNEIIFLISLGIVVLLTFPFIYWGLAPRNLFFTFVEEGWAKLVGRGTAFKRAITASKDYIIDDNWNVILVRNKANKEKYVWVKDGEIVPKGTPGARKYKRRYFWGGLRFYGIYPYMEILKYNFHWAHLHEDGSIVHHNEKELDAVLLKTDLYVIELPITAKNAAKDIDGVPIGIAIVLPMRIANVYEAMFLYRRWLVLISGTVQATLRRFVARYRYKEDLLAMSAGRNIEARQKTKGISDTFKAKEGEDLLEKFWDELSVNLTKRAREEGTEAETKDETIRVFGVELQKRGYGVLSVEPDPEYRRWTTAKYEAEREKEIRVIGAEAEEEARTKETVGTLIGMLAKATGKSEETITKEISESDDLKKEFLVISKDLLEREMAIKGESFLDIRLGGPGTEGLQGMLAPLIALLRRIPSKKGKKKDKKQEEDEEEKKET